MNAQTLQGKVLLILPSKEHLHLIDLQLVPADARTLFWGSAWCNFHNSTLVNGSAAPNDPWKVKAKKVIKLQKRGRAETKEPNGENSYQRQGFGQISEQVLCINVFSTKEDRFNKNDIRQNLFWAERIGWLKIDPLSVSQFSLILSFSLLALRSFSFVFTNRFQFAFDTEMLIWWREERHWTSVQ